MWARKRPGFTARPPSVSSARRAARGAEQHSSGTDTAQAFVNLALALGLPGRPFSGYGTITGQGNGQGGREHGQKADQLPGYRRLDDPAARAHVAGVWGIDPAELPKPGKSAFEMLDGLVRPTKPERKTGAPATIDRFFRTLAESYERNAVCIVLSGTGSDGTLGLKRIK